MVLLPERGEAEDLEDITTDFMVDIDMTGDNGHHKRACSKQE
ncbi:hypothetical protein [Geoglobus acetivorans]|uniref:Uncharacterized protein n=1 Tax=Geoglobus acetivorans TaxID=565033 RepID=A0A0A7GFS3_GEOAI|nr:hypothetical protein GACE_1862 [Geoglobus acetivorans]